MSLTIPCHSNHDALWGVSKGSGLDIWFQPFSNKTVCTRGLSVEIIILCSRTFAPKCAACLQPILPAEVSNGSLARDSLLLHHVYAVKYLYRNGSQVEFKFAWACTAVFLCFSCFDSSGESGVMACDTGITHYCLRKLFWPCWSCVSGQWGDSQGGIHEQRLSLWVLSLWGELYVMLLFSPSRISRFSDHRNERKNQANSTMFGGLCSFFFPKITTDFLQIWTNVTSQHCAFRKSPLQAWVQLKRS